jgi:dTDP-4-amino-4,6-dideoxygalactose transaminase
VRLAILGNAKPAFEKPIYVTRPVLPSTGKFMEKIETIFKSGILTNAGPFSLELEKAIAKYLKVPDCALICNGTIALQLALSSYRLSGEIITTPFTFPATVHVIAWNQITPVFCDIDPETYNIDVNQIENLITSKTTAILPVHVYGIPCDVEKIDVIAKRHGLRVIYDAAPAFAVRYKGFSIGNFGDASMFSFHGTKIFSTFEGGALVSSDDFFMQRVRVLRNFGIISETDVVSMGINGKINEIQCAFGLTTLELIEGEIEKRKKLYGLYLNALKSLPGLYFQKIDKNVEQNYQYFPLRINRDEYGLNRDELVKVLNAENVFPRKYYYPLCSQYPIYRGLPFSSQDKLPVANRVADNIICLPLYGDLSPASVEKVIRIIEQAHQDQKKIAGSV